MIAGFLGRNSYSMRCELLLPVSFFLRFDYSLVRSSNDVNFHPCRTGSDILPPADKAVSFDDLLGMC